MARVKRSEVRRLKRQQDRKQQPEQQLPSPKIKRLIYEVIITISFDQPFDHPMTAEEIDSDDALYNSIDDAAQQAAYVLGERLNCDAGPTEIKQMESLYLDDQNKVIEQYWDKYLELELSKLKSSDD